MKVLIATGIYPPEIGGPALYAFNLEREFVKLGHGVEVRKFSIVHRWPSGLRHLLFFLKAFPAVYWADWCLILDTFSVGLPTVLAAKILNKKTIVRIGGDFLWEQYVERTGRSVLLRNFYRTELNNFTAKERLIFKLTRWLLHNCTTVVFSTSWQRQIWQAPYRLDLAKTKIIENYYGPKEQSSSPREKDFIGSVRNLKWKNLEGLKRAFAIAKTKNTELVLNLDNLPHHKFLERLRNCYAVILVSLGDVSPNSVLDAIRLGKPFILTKETGLMDRLQEVGLFVDPQNKDEIAEKILWLAEKKNYEFMSGKIDRFIFIHSWTDIANDFLRL